MPAMELKRISPASVPQALEKAEGYRLRNDPAQAESICRDVLAVDGVNHEVLRGLVLALTDQFGGDGAAGAPREAQTLVDRLTEALRPPGSDDAVLRWNSCARAIESERRAPAPRAPELPLE